MNDAKKEEKRKLNPKATTFTFGKKQFVKGMKKPSRLPKGVEFPADFFAVEAKEVKKEASK